MKYRRMDANGDYIMGNGKNDFLTDLEAFVQACETKLNLFRGEWWEDLTKGIPFFQEIAGAFMNSAEEVNLVSQVYLSELTTVPEYKELISFEDSFDAETRRFSLTARIDSTYGTSNIEV